MTEDEQDKALKIFLEENPGINIVNAALRAECAALAERAEEASEQYYGARDLSAKRLEAKDKGLLSIRTKRRESGTTEISWIKLRHIPKDRRKDQNGRKTFCEHIKKGPTRDDYPRSHVLKGNYKAHEVDLFDVFEPRFSFIRRQSRLLGNAIKSIKAYQRSLQDK